MGYELETALEFNRDRIIKNQMDQTVRARLQILAGTRENPLQKEKTNLVFLLDSSASMDEAYYDTGMIKRDAVFQAVQTLFEQVETQDTVTLVSFNSQAIVHADHAPGGAKSVLITALDSYLKDNGATNFEAAMNMARSVTSKGAKGHYKLIFLTDGHAYTGNNQKAFETCKALAQSGITTDAMGIGETFKFDFMKQFSDFSGSLTENITPNMPAPKVFSQIYTQLSNLFLKKVFINIHLENMVRDVHFYMHEPEQKNLHDFIHQSDKGTLVQINAGDIEQQGFKEFLFDFTLDTPDTASMKIGRAVIHFDCPSRNIAGKEVDLPLYLNFADTSAEEIMDSSIDAGYKDIEILVNQNEVFKLIDQKKYDEAALRLEAMASLAEQIGDYDKATGFREMKNKLMRDQNLTQADLNDIAYTSSRSSVRSRIHSSQYSDTPIY